MLQCDPRLAPAAAQTHHTPLILWQNSNTEKYNFFGTPHLSWRWRKNSMASAGSRLQQITVRSLPKKEQVLIHTPGEVAASQAVCSCRGTGSLLCSSEYKNNNKKNITPNEIAEETAKSLIFYCFPPHTHFSETLIIQHRPQNLQFLSNRSRLSGAKLFVLCLYTAKHNRIPIPTRDF